MNRTCIEPLEARIAPAGVVLTYTEVDGDFISIKLSADVGAVLTALPNPTAATQTVLAIPDVAAADGLNIAITVKRGPNGDGFVSFGRIDATGVNLGKVTVSGDLAEIDAGDNTAGAVALNALKVRSMGMSGAKPIPGGSDLHSVLKGKVESITVLKDFDGVLIDVESLNSEDSVISKLTIGGNVIGRDPAESGRIEANKIGAVVVKGSILGGDGKESGAIEAFSGGIINAKIGGSVVGGVGEDSGQLVAGGSADAGVWTIAGDVRGGAGLSSGKVRSADPITSFAMRGSIIGGRGDFSGQVDFFGANSVTVGGSVIGGSSEAGLLSGSGTLSAGGGVEVVKVGGSIIGGVASGTGSLQDCGQLRMGGILKTSVLIGGSIIAGRDSDGVLVPGSGGVVVSGAVGTFNLKGSLIGNSTMQAFISITGDGTPGLLLGKLSIGGDMIDGRITGGFGPPVPSGFFDPKFSDVQFGTIEVKGDFRASNIALAIEAGPDGAFGTADDIGTTPPLSPNPAFISSIASITVKGAVAGNGSGAAHLGFVAEQIGKLRLGGVNIALGAGFDVIDLPVPGGNVSVRERAVV